MNPPTVTACVPCFNGSQTLGSAISSIRAQTARCGEILVVDDGSTDSTARIAGESADRVIAQGTNLGRGSARARAVIETSSEFLLFCDAGVFLAKNFLERALIHLQSPHVAAAFGRITQTAASGPVQRWRGRHLFKTEKHQEAQSQAILATGCALVRREAVLQVGNFDPNLRAGEDADLGARLLAAGFEVVFDPQLEAAALESDSLWKVLNRYARWNTAPNVRPPFQDYLRLISYASKVMVREDLARGDWSCALISFLLPHYQFWRARFNLHSK